jgi:hypothetical protein
MIKVGDTVRCIYNIYEKHGRPGVSKNMTPNRAKVRKPGFLIHTIKLRDNPLERLGVHNKFPRPETFIMTIQGGTSSPYTDPYPMQAIWAKRTTRQEYTFMGIFELNANSTDANRIYDRISDKYDPQDPDMGIVGFVKPPRRRRVA